MSEDLEVDDDVFLEGGVLSCICGQALEEEEAIPLIKTEARPEVSQLPLLPAPAEFVINVHRQGQNPIF